MQSTKDGCNMIKVVCGVCGKELEEPGAIYLGIPNEGCVDKDHICVSCNELVLGLIQVLKDALK